MHGPKELEIDGKIDHMVDLKKKQDTHMTPMGHPHQKHTRNFSKDECPMLDSSTLNNAMN